MFPQRNTARHSITRITIVTIAACLVLGMLNSDQTGASAVAGDSDKAPPVTQPPARLVAAAAVAIEAVPADSAGSVDALRDLARRDPTAFMRMCLDRYERDIRDYTCVFHKHERISGKLRKTEEIEVRYRESPKSVFMIWRKNADQAKRVLFRDGPEYVNDKGEKLARIEPAGALIRLVVSDIMMPIHGKRARKSSRRPIDQFGFRAALEKLLADNRRAASRGDLDFRFAGESEVDGRPTFVFERTLPYGGPQGAYPNARMVMHIDQQWLLPTAIYTYADTAGKKLLGSYVYTAVVLNPDLNDAAFRF